MEDISKMDREAGIRAQTGCGHRYSAEQHCLEAALSFRIEASK